MVTCCSMNCPFITYCKDYNFIVDRTGGCETQKSLINITLKLAISDAINKTNELDKKLYSFNISLESNPNIKSLKTRKLKDKSTVGNGKCCIDFYFE